MKYFNNEEPINLDFRSRLEQHFEYYWNNNNFAALEDEEGNSMFEQLPIQVQNSLMKDYLFVNFVKTFQKSYFRIPKATDFRFSSIVKY